MFETRHSIFVNQLHHHVLDSLPEGEPVGAVLCLHGFPDDHGAWRALTPFLVQAGYRVIAPDLRGFGETELAGGVAAYDFFTGPMPDVIGLLDTLNIARAHLVGHDFGAALAWLLAAQHPDRFKTLTAMAVGHQRALLRARFDAGQQRKSRYILWHQLRGLCEWAYQREDWAWFRRHWAGHYDIEGAIEKLSRPGRLSGGLNWYRANISLRRMLFEPRLGAFGDETVRIPALGLWSDGDAYLDEAQMQNSADYVDAAWRYERFHGLGHWLQAEAPEAVARLMLAHWERLETSSTS